MKARRRRLQDDVQAPHAEAACQERQAHRAGRVGGPASLPWARDIADARLSLHRVRLPIPRRAACCGARFRSSDLPDTVSTKRPTISSTRVRVQGLVIASTMKSCSTKTTTVDLHASGAPRGPASSISRPQGRRRQLHIGIEWRHPSRSGHVRRSSGKRVIVLGGGNTAMDCCRTARGRRPQTSRW